MVDDILTSIQCWFSTAILKLIAYNSEYMIILNRKIVKHGVLRLQEDDY